MGGLRLLAGGGWTGFYMSSEAASATRNVCASASALLLLQGQEEALGLSVQLSDAKQQVSQLAAALESARQHLQAQQAALAAQQAERAELAQRAQDAEAALEKQQAVTTELRRVMDALRCGAGRWAGYSAGKKEKKAREAAGCYFRAAAGDAMRVGGVEWWKDYGGPVSARQLIRVLLDTSAAAVPPGLPTLLTHHTAFLFLQRRPKAGALAEERDELRQQLELARTEAAEAQKEVGAEPEESRGCYCCH